MDWHEHVPARVGFWALLVLGLFAWAPALYPGYWQGTEGFAPVFQAVMPSAIATMATAPDLWRGAGSAAYLIAQPLLLMGAEPVLAVRITFIVCFLLGGSAVYVWLADRLGDRSAALAGLVYLLLPVFLATVYVRGSVSNALVLALLPLALAGLASYSDRRSIVGAAVAALSILWLWRIQAGLALFATALLLLYTLFVERQRLTVLIVVAAGAAGLASLIPLWSVSSPPPVTFTEHFVHFFQLFGTGWATAPSSAGWQDRYPFQLGYAVIVFGPLTLWGLWFGRSADISPLVRRLVNFSFAGAAAIAALSLTISAPLWVASQADRLLTWPWQILLVAAPLLAVLAGALPVTLPDLESPVYWVVLVTITLVAGSATLAPAYTQVQPPLRPIALFGDNHFVILSAQISEEQSPQRATLEITWQALHPMAFDHNVFFQALTGNGENATVVAQIDVQPLGGRRPATSWQPGEILHDTYSLDLSQAPTGKKLTYYFGYYDWRNGTRLPVDGGRDDKLVLHGE